MSGIEANFENGEVWFGSMPDSRKSVDLARDPRLALHSTSDDPPSDPVKWPGDAKISGRAVAADDPEQMKGMSGEPDGPGVLYRIEITEIVLTRVNDPPDHLLVQVWTPGGGLRTLKAS